jgi:hypothetical protein
VEPSPVVQSPVVSHQLDVTEVWEIEPRVSQANVPTDRHRPLSAEDIRAALAQGPSPAPRKAVSGEVWLDVALDRHEPAPAVTSPALPEPSAPPSVPRLSLPEPSERPSIGPLAAPTFLPVTSSGSIAIAPASTSRKGWVAAGTVAVLWITLGGIGWMVWPREAEHEAKPMEPVVVAPTVEAPVARPEPVVEAAADQTTVPVPPAEPAPAPVDPAPTPAPEPAPVTSEPVPAVEPAVVEEPPTPPEPKPAAKPVRKKPAKPKPAGPPAGLTIAPRLFGDMDIEIDGKVFSVNAHKGNVQTVVTPGKVKVRWRRPLSEWKQKWFVIEPGLSYKVALDERGPIILPMPKKTP